MDNELQRYRRSCQQSDLQGLIDVQTRLTEEKIAADRRTRIATNQDVQAIKEDLHRQILSIRELYMGIATNNHPNVVISDLAFLQGREKEALTQLNFWADSGEVKKDVDAHLQICEEVLEEKTRQGDRR